MIARSIPFLAKTVVSAGLLAACPVLYILHSELPRSGKPILQGAAISRAVRSDFERACSDCHSDNTVWPWYSRLPVISSLIRRDVEAGRSFMNLSRWQSYSPARKRGFLSSIAMALRTRSMPDPKYVLLHQDATLSEADVRALEGWVQSEQVRLRKAVSR